MLKSVRLLAAPLAKGLSTQKPLLSAAYLVYRPMNLVTDTDGIAKLSDEKTAAELQRQKHLSATHTISGQCFEILLALRDGLCEQFVAASPTVPPIIYGTTKLYEASKLGGYPCPRLDALVVGKEFRRLGIGTRLLELAADKAKSWVSNQMYYVIHPSEDMGIKFLVKKGFKVTRATYGCIFWSHSYKKN